MSCIISYLAFDKCGSSMKRMVHWDDEENGESEMEPFEEASEIDVSDDEQSNDEEPRIKNVLENLSKSVSRERASDLFHSMAATKDILFWTPRGQILRKNRIIPVTNMLFKVYQITQLIKEPTRIVERSSTLLDLAFTTDQGRSPILVS